MPKLERGVTLTKSIRYFFQNLISCLLISPNKLTKFYRPTFQPLGNFIFFILHLRSTTLSMKAPSSVQGYMFHGPNSNTNVVTTISCSQETCDRRTANDPKAICSINLFEVGGGVVRVGVRWGIKSSFLFQKWRVGVLRIFQHNCLCWGFTAQSTQWGHVERGQFT